MEQAEHRDTTPVSHNIYCFKRLADRYSALSAVFDGVAFACLIASAFILLEAVAW